MNPTAFDPDLKIHMSLDEIIKLTKPELDSQLNKKLAKRRRNRRRKSHSSTADNCVPLFTLGGGRIMVTKNSPLLSAANKRRIANAVSNIQINSELIEKSKQIIPARYKLIKTDCGVERVLVPAEGKNVNARQILRKLMKNSRALLNLSLQHPRPLQPPPLGTCPKRKFNESMKMEVDEDEDEIEVIEVEDAKVEGNPEVIDVESESGTEGVGSHNLRTLNDRFTHLANTL